MADEFTIEDFNEMLKDPKIREAWDRYMAFERLIAMQSLGLQKEIDDKCREFIKQKYGKEEI